MRSYLYILCGLAVLVLSGCASTERFQRDMDNYLGWDIKQLREHFGYNYLDHDLGDGTRAYTWVWSERNLYQGYQSPDVIHSYKSADGSARVLVSPGTYFPPSYDEYHCEITFITGQDERVIRWRAQGDGCATYRGPGSVLEHAAPNAAPTAAP